MKTGYNVIDAMTRMVVTVSLDTSIQECSILMAQEKIGSVVVKEGESVRGIITETDIVRKVVAHNLHVVSTTAKKVMTPRIVSIEPEKDIYDALVVMRDADIKHLPVIDKGKLSGILTMKDILKIEPQLFDLVVEKYRLREEENKPVSTRKEGRCDLCGDYFENLNDADGMSLCNECLDQQEDELEA